MFKFRVVLLLISTLAFGLAATAVEAQRKTQAHATAGTSPAR